MYLCGHERGHESGDIEDCVAGDCGQHYRAAAGTGGHRHRRAPGRQGVYRRCGGGRDDVQPGVLELRVPAHEHIGDDGTDLWQQGL